MSADAGPPPNVADRPPAQSRSGDPLDRAVGEAWSDLWHPRPPAARLARGAAALARADSLDEEGREADERRLLRRMLAARRAGRRRRILAAAAVVVCTVAAGPFVARRLELRREAVLADRQARLIRDPLAVPVRLWAEVVLSEAVGSLARLAVPPPVAARPAGPTVRLRPADPVRVSPAGRPGPDASEETQGGDPAGEEGVDDLEASASFLDSATEGTAASSAPIPGDPDPAEAAVTRAGPPKRARAGYGVDWPGGLTDAQVATGSRPAHPAGGERWARIPDGPFHMGSQPGTGDRHEWPRHRVDVPAFEIDVYETTLGAFAAWCLRARDVCRWRPMDAADADPDRPVTGVTWREARLFCADRGGRLPNEEEWEKAARYDPATARERTYPWGNESPDCAYVSFAPCHEARPRKVGEGRAAAVASPAGVVDLAGNAGEWVRDLYGPYPGGRADRNPRPDLGELRVVRGGSFGGDRMDVRGADRDAHAAEVRNPYVGFRCARDPSPPAP